MKAFVAKFSILKGRQPKITKMRLADMKCRGECTCKCCK